jgi:hypothetical protein
MKKILFFLYIIGYTSTAIAQHEHDSQKQPAESKQPSTKLPTNDSQNTPALTDASAAYINIKNALVAGDASSASRNADIFLRKVNTIDFKIISEGNLHILAKNAGQITSSKDLEKQRRYFAGLSENMAVVAREFKLNDREVYLQYCPMKKASWLSYEKEIRNPYYGSSMLTCGETKEQF